MSGDKPLPEGFTMDSEIENAIRDHLVDGHLSCAHAHAIARAHNVLPALIGHTVDALNIRLTRCQLGLFGYPHKKGWAASGVTELPTPERFVKALKEAAGDENKITCLALWQLAAEYKVSRMQAGYLADGHNIQIMHCQIGAF